MWPDLLPRRRRRRTGGGVSFEQLDLFRDILGIFAEHAYFAHDREWATLAAYSAEAAERNRESVRTCIAMKQLRGCPKLAESRRKAARAHHARAKADPVKWAALQARLRARYEGATP